MFKFLYYYFKSKTFSHHDPDVELQTKAIYEFESRCNWIFFKIKVFNLMKFNDN